MRILQQIIKKKMELSQEFLLNRQYKRGIWQFYCVYNICLSILNKPDDKIRLRNKLWKRFLLREFDESGFKKIQKIMREDIKVIIDALKFIEAESQKMGYDVGDIYKPSMIGILSFEYPEG